MTTYTFETVRRGAQRTGACPACGKRTTRRRTFEQTVNPFNRNLDGSVKSRDEVFAAVSAEAAAWEPDFRHGACVEEDAEAAR
ncbi:Uncharacterised protein (plasmid) [Tsukamurella tyrosinosolvens]|uniref:Uncharacterized protein n=1 Tax=Tsukamurella tyrosinosolvens TaxID=57704 RepID=A0A1H4VMK5_TSUTY|nr:hypothetical protein [Tsukamurella tyrosinosolvens]KXO90934.1 hypothetical protein AXK58_21100 [Tsukamurella tyrosinosolvens]SEC82329.1 hypothetical protein SAMN04489793_3279 [Tsukamurella tyrosinosolvens]VEH90415.1 Uncharacterised protein [Tsukamurella tyrosinosolvens]